MAGGRIGQVRDHDSGGRGEFGDRDRFAVGEQVHGGAHQVPAGLLVGAEQGVGDGVGEAVGGHIGSLPCCIVVPVSIVGSATGGTVKLRRWFRRDRVPMDGVSRTRRVR